MAGQDQKDIYYTQGLPVPQTPEAGKEPRPWGATDIVGKKRPRVDAYERLSGAAVYPSDFALPGMLYGAILRCPYPHARVKKIDSSAAARICWAACGMKFFRPLKSSASQGLPNCTAFRRPPTAGCASAP